MAEGGRVKGKRKRLKRGVEKERARERESERSNSRGLEAYKRYRIHRRVLIENSISLCWEAF